MFCINEKVNEIDLGDQVFLEFEDKTLSVNAIGRIIYLQIREGKTIADIVEYFRSLYGENPEYQNDVKAFIDRLIELGLVQKIS